MAEPAGPFHLLQAGPGRYLCYCCPGPGAGGTVYVTDALEVWAGELGARPPLGCRCQPEEHGTKLREALGRGAASLSLGEGKATLQLREEARCSDLDLFKLPIAEARSQLQALVFGMAGRVESLERRLEGGPSDPAQPATGEGCASLASPRVVSPHRSQMEWPGALGSRGAAFFFLFGLASSQSWPGSAPDHLGQKRSCMGPEDAVSCLSAETQP
ncbi:protein PAXX isoform X3 [Aptenodytes patagonicus]|uniref:protein PAXX isoform X3 n=1 Tax=Aptenodytes patagonicus TaxID=9234 RepID=UPI003FA08507